MSQGKTNWQDEIEIEGGLHALEALDAWVGTLHGRDAYRNSDHGNGCVIAKTVEWPHAESRRTLCKRYGRIHEVLHGKYGLPQSVLVHGWRRPSNCISSDRSQHI